MSCTYRSPEGQGCTRQGIATTGSPKCVFHLPASAAEKMTLEKFVDELRELIRYDNGNWVGFVFPKNFTLAKMSV